MGELARNWITAHTYVDLGLQAVVLAVCVLLTLLAISAAFYSLWWLLRLLRPANVARFTARDIPGIRKGKLAGQELEFGEVASAESKPSARWARPSKSSASAWLEPSGR
jgi:hypothetical protein